MPHTLLLADDSVTIQRVIELTFADEDIRVLAVSDGDQAIAAVNQAPPDIVLADVGMPGRNGYEVAHHIKNTPRLSHIPVLLLTGAFEPIDQARATQAGCAGVLAKPFEPQLVIGRVKELLASAGQGPARSAAATAAAATAPAPAAAVQDAPWDRAFAATPGAPAKAPLSADIDNYFDRLDQAFATLATTGPSTSQPAPANEPIDWFSPERTSVQVDFPLSYGSAEADFERPAAASPAPVAHDAADSTRAAEPAGGSRFEFETVPPLRLQTPASDPGVHVPEPNLHHPQEPAPVRAPETVVVHAQEAAALEPASVYAMEPLAAPAPKTASVPPPASVAMAPLADAFTALLAAERTSAPAEAAPGWPGMPLAAAQAFNADELVERVTQQVLDRLTDRVVRETVAGIVATTAERLIVQEIERIKANIK